MKTLQDILKNNPQYQLLLFTRGFLFTDAKVKADQYPFFGSWRQTDCGAYHLLVHPAQKCFLDEKNGRTVILIGHAYDPFSMVADEQTIVRELNERYSERDVWLDYFNGLTGLFTLLIVEQDRVSIYSDCASMQIAYYGWHDKNLYVSTHMQLIGDLCGLEQSDYVKKLLKYRFYKKYGSFLPGDLSAFDGIRRVVPNTFVTLCQQQSKIERFYPVRDIKMTKNDAEYRQALEEICDILYKNMQLISRKWDAPAISMTGGMDSKGTVAAANGLYEKFLYFSYISMYGEQTDADAAHKIAEAIGVNHRIDRISERNEDFPDLDIARQIIHHNYGHIGKQNENDIRKRLFYWQNPYFDVEVKSWVSEIARANYCKKFGFRKMPQNLTPRRMSTMYKLFTYNRLQLYKTDAIFKQYKADVRMDQHFNIDPADLFLWEVRYGSWGGQVITCEHKFSFDITIPYNNRKLLELMLSVPREKRISDQLHDDLIEHMNPKITETGITITNYNETKKRMWMEKVYFLINTHVPF